MREALPICLTGVDVQQSLFRTKAIEHQKDRLHGEVLLTPSLSHLLPALFISLWLIALFAWLVNSQYARQETVSGWLEPSKGVTKIYAHDATGHIQKLLVEEGQNVKAGEALVVINRGKTMLSGAGVESTQLKEYKSQQRLIEQQLARMETKNAIEMSNIQQDLYASRSELSKINEQINTLKSRQKLVVSRLDNYSEMNRQGHITDIEIDRLLEQQLSLKNEEQRLIRERISANNQIALLSSKAKMTPFTQLDNESILRVKLSELALNIAQMQGQKEYVLGANSDGVVNNLQIKEGQQVWATTPLMSVLPENSEIVAKLLIPVKAAGFVKPGQQIDVRYDAFPFQKFGLYKAEVVHVSNTAILPNEAAKIPIQFNEPVYLVQAHLIASSVSAYGKDLPLKSGMTLSGDIRLSERSLLEWMLEPLVSLRGRLQ